MPTLQDRTQGFETVAILQPQSVTIYKSFPRSARDQTEAELANLEKGKNGQYNGYLSPTSARQIKKFLSSWLTSLELQIHKQEKQTGRASNRLYPTFVTLTLPAEQIHDDNFIKRHLLNRLIIRLKEKFDVQHYFWRAEPQKNGNLHFHLLIDRWIYWKDVRKLWNRILDDHGYIDLYRQNQQLHHLGGFKLRPELLKNWPESRQRQAHKEGIESNWSNPNTTDIHAIRKVKSLSAYVVKYVCKTPEQEEGQQQNRQIQGRIWGCNDQLRELRHFRETVSFTQNFQEFTNQTMSGYLRDLEKEADEGDIFEDEYIKVIRLKKPQIELLQQYSEELLRSYLEHYSDILTNLYPLPLEESRQEPAIIHEPAPF
jgi:hypothetical protein